MPTWSTPIKPQWSARPAPPSAKRAVNANASRPSYSAGCRRKRISKRPMRRWKSPTAGIRMRSRKCATARRCWRNAVRKWRSRASSSTTRCCARRSTAWSASAWCSPASTGPRARRSSPSFASIRCACSSPCLSARRRRCGPVSACASRVEGDPTVYEGRVVSRQSVDCRRHTHAADRGGDPEPRRQAAPRHLRQG